MNDNISTLERIDMCGQFLDKLTDANGRAKCGYIYILNEFLDAIRKDVLVMTEQLKDLQNNQNGTETQGGEGG